MSELERARLLREQGRVLREEMERARSEGMAGELPDGRPGTTASGWALGDALGERQHKVAGRQRVISQRRRARKKQATIGPRFMIDDVIARDGQTCYLCRIEPPDAERVLEHIIPLARGGSHTLSNAAIACADCNARKAARFVAFDTLTHLPRFLPR